MIEGPLWERSYSHIRSQKGDQIGIPLLKDGEKKVSDSARKAEILSNQFQSVFTEEDVRNQ